MYCERHRGAALGQLRSDRDGRHAPRQVALSHCSSRCVCISSTVLNRMFVFNYREAFDRAQIKLFVVDSSESQSIRVSYCYISSMLYESL